MFRIFKYSIFFNAYNHEKLKRISRPKLICNSEGILRHKASDTTEQLNNSQIGVLSHRIPISLLVL